MIKVTRKFTVFSNVKYICDSVVYIWDITANSTKQIADYKVANIDTSEEEQGISFFSYTFQFSLAVLQFLQCLALMQHPLTSLLPFFQAACQYVMQEGAR